MIISDGKIHMKIGNLLQLDISTVISSVLQVMLSGNNVICEIIQNTTWENAPNAIHKQRSLISCS